MLTDLHRAKLQACGLTPETWSMAQLHSAPETETRLILGYGVGPGLVIPYAADYARVRIDHPGPDGKRYRSPRAAGNRLYVPAMLPAGLLVDPAVAIHLTEGEFKALKATQEGFPCLGLAGVWSWKTRLHGKSLGIPDLDRVAWKGRRVVVVFDSDLAEKPPVAWAEHALVQDLRGRGAEVYVLRLPDGLRGAKVGLDDYLVAEGSAAFKSLPMLTIAEADQSQPTYLRVSDLADAYWLAASTPHHRVTTGYPELDGIVRGIAPGEVMQVLGRSGVGKTAFLLNLVEQMTHVGQVPTLVFSLEMSGTELFERMASLTTGLHGRDIEQAARDEDPQLAERFLSVVERWQHVVIVERSCTIEALDRLIEGARAGNLWPGPLRLVCVDYMGLLGPRRPSTPYEAVSEAAKELKRLAKRHRVAILSLCQVGREGESGGEPVTLHSGRDSVTGETPVLLADGRYVPIETLVGQMPELVALNDVLEPVIAKASRVWKKGERFVFRVQTRTGRQMRVTLEHPFRTESGWVPLKNLRPGDRIAGPRSLPIFGTGDLSSDEGLLLGLLVGDGALTGKVIEYTDGNESVRQACVDVSSRLGVVPHPRPKEPRTLVFSNGGHRGVINPVRALVERAGLYGLKSPERFVPQLVFMAPKDAMSAFLRGLWSTDGGVTRRGLKFSSASEALVRGVAHLLIRFGIRASIGHERHGKGGYSGSQGKSYWVVNIRNDESIQKFREHIGLIGTKHQRLIDWWPAGVPAPVDRTLDCLSRTLWPRIHEVRRRRGMEWLETFGASGVDERRDISRRRMLSIAETLDSGWMRVLATSPTVFDEIVSIEPDGSATVYDATVPVYRSFMAGDLFPSNSGVLEEAADYVLGIWRPELAERLDKAAREAKRGEFRVRVLKNRGGPAPRTVTLRFEAGTLRVRAGHEVTSEVFP